MGLVGVAYRFGLTYLGKVTVKTETFGRFRFCWWAMDKRCRLELIAYSL